jgi:hypothetical protein
LATNPLFIAQPRTVTQAARIGALRLVLAANPALPGTNHFVVTLVDHGRVIRGARVRLAAMMPGMVMRPLIVSAGEQQGGHYTGAAPLPMFGRWQLAVVVERRHAAPVRHVFALNLDFPSRLLKALGAHSGTR